MTGFLDRILGQSRAVLTLTAVMAAVGLYFCLTIPREASPDIDLPVFAITVVQEGLSAEDTERLLVRPIETVLRGVEGLKELTAISRPSRASLFAEFELSADYRSAFATLREKLAVAKTQLPDAAEDPLLEQANPGLLPVMTVALSGDVPERSLQMYAGRLKERVEAIPEILHADLAGNRAELIEVIVDQSRLQAYGISEAELVAATQHRKLVAAGDVDAGGTPINVRAPGLFSSEDDILRLPLRSVAGGVVTLRDVAQIRRTFKDAASYARVNGRPALIMQISKAPGANIVDANRAVRQVVEAYTSDWPATVRVDILLDQSRHVFEILGSLQGTLLTAALLVMVVTLFTLDIRSSLLVGLAIPLSFLIGFMMLGLAGVTMNRMVIFALILTVGMVIDGAIVLVEYAQRGQSRGLSRPDAYRVAARQVFWPILASTATTIIVFAPLLFWPGVAGKLLNPLPITAIAVLLASLLVTLLVLPMVGGAGRRGTPRASSAWRGAIGPSPLSLPILEAQQQIAEGRALVPVRRSASSASSRQRPEGPQSFMTLWYLNLLDWAIRRPITIVGTMAGLLVVVLIAFRLFGQGIEFFVETEPEEAVLQIFGRGSLSAREELDLVRGVEAEIRQMEGVRTVLAVSGRLAVEAAAERTAPGSVRRDLIGQITVEFMDYRERPKGKAMLQELRSRTASMPGIQVEVRKRETGPAAGKPVQLEISSSNRETALVAAAVVRQRLDNDRQFRDVEDSRPVPELDWVLKVDREEAARYRADIASINAVIQMVTNGVLVGKFRPVDSENEIEIRARFPSTDRTIGQLEHLSLRTPGGLLPIGNFVERKPQPQSGERLRKDRRYVVTVAANVADGARADDKIRELSGWMQTQQWQPDTAFQFRGASEDRKQAADFLQMAMLVALFLIFVILVAQFDNFFQAAVTLATVLLSIIGVVAGMLATGQSFSVIMTGTAILALSGIVVNNAIMLIDRANQYMRIGMPQIAALRRSCAERARPVLLTALTTAIALAPSALQVSLDIFGPSIEFGSIASVWWVQFSTAMIFGLAFATLLTLLVVPTALAAPIVLRERWRRYEADRIASYVNDRNATTRQPRLLKRT